MKPKTVLITGAATRVGMALTRYYADNGWEVVIHYNSSGVDAKHLSEELQQHYRGRKFPILQANLENISECEMLIKNAPHLDALINNASVFEPGLLSSSHEKHYRRQMAVNFDAPFFLMQNYYNRFGKGVIINILDTRVVNNDSSYGAYSLAKKSLMQLTSMAALEWAPKVRVNAVAPGPVLPPEGKNERYFRRVVEATPLKKQVNIDNLCKSAYFLTEIDDITGQVLFCDGGAHLK